MVENYVDYFKIDPEYFPVVDETVIRDHPDLWLKYYPHETFVKLLDLTEKALSRKVKRSLWVEGAYGTGKSHAVLTLKKLLDADEEQTKEYFEKYPEQLTKDLFNRFQGAKNSGKILTVHRYGSSSINGDNNLITAIQESIIAALDEAGIENKGSDTLKNNIIKWLSDEDNRLYFDSKIEKKYKDLFNGDKAEDLIKKLAEYSEESLTSIIDKITQVAQNEGFSALLMDIDDIVNWIEDVIKANHLKAIIFIWDEFTEYFINNVKSLTGFQRIAQISATSPFYLMIVTHKSEGLFDDKDPDKKKIFDRFETPCLIELPENMAFTLMGKAMEKNPDEMTSAEWEEYSNDLYDRTRDSREIIKRRVKIGDKELKDILPIHPYSALLLKYMATAFASNQRSMFDFIKSGSNENEKGFQWFMQNYGPLDEDPLLTVDLLWDFFYSKKDNLDRDIRSILECYSISNTRKLNSDQDKVLKSILLLQAISQNVGNAVELFIPNAENLNNAFEGSDLENGKAEQCAEQLVKEEVLFKKNIGNNKFQYSVFVSTGDKEAIEKFKKQIGQYSTTKLVEDGEIADALNFKASINLRFNINYASLSDFDSKIKKLNNEASNKPGKITAVLTFAKDETESSLLQKRIYEAAKSGEYGSMVFIDTSANPLGQADYEQYVDNMANSLYQKGKDNHQSLQYEINAKEVLRRWKGKVSKGSLTITTSDFPNGINLPTQTGLFENLLSIDKNIYPECLEYHFHNVIDNLFTNGLMKKGVECGAMQETASTYRTANPKQKLETALEGAWKEEEYWKKTPYLYISKLKIAVDELITKRFETTGRISIKEVYDMLCEAPYGFLPCNLTAFVMGFVLKEYTDGRFNCSDNINIVTLDVEKLKEIVEEVIKLQITPNKRYVDKYIVSMTENEKSFNHSTAKAFDVSESSCSTIENTRSIIRNRMKALSFPIWCLKELLDSERLHCDKEILANVIDCYTGIANDENYSGKKTANDLANDIGALCIAHPEIVDDLKYLFTVEKCTEGMIEYLKKYNGGELYLLAQRIGDNGNYINKVKATFDADAANWVWNETTACSRIDNVILDYRVIEESNKHLPKTTDIEHTISEWCDKCKNIKIAYQAAKNYMGTLGDFLELLYSLKRTNSFGQNEHRFYEELKLVGKDFDDFYSDQLPAFKKVCSFYVDDLEDEDINKILLQKIPRNVFTDEKNQYLSSIETIVKDYKASLVNIKLKNLWHNMTNTESPAEWSREYKMPIQCMVGNNEIEDALRTFAAINSKKSSENEIKRAIEFLQSATFLSTLSSEEERNRAFRNRFLKNYSVIIDDLSDLKNYLIAKVGNNPYYWFSYPVAEEALRKYAEAKYISQGCDKALDVIESMDTNLVKSYLKDLIKDNMNVGIEIIKGN